MNLMLKFQRDGKPLLARTGLQTRQPEVACRLAPAAFKLALAALGWDGAHCSAAPGPYYFLPTTFCSASLLLSERSPALIPAL